jgi:hypothetical protein
VSGVENCLGRLLAELEKPVFDAACVERDLCELASSIVAMSHKTSRAERGERSGTARSVVAQAEIDRVLALHAALRALVEEKRDETGRKLDSVVRARACISRLTRPGDLRAALDLEA